MTLLQIWIDSIRHYDRMIKWAKGQDLDQEVGYTPMQSQLSESWFSSDCSYCRRYLITVGHEINDENVCSVSCPLNHNTTCCGGEWFTMNNSDDWREWIYNAKQIRRFIIKHGLRYNNGI